jgi:protein-tyrosine-phosphatase/predicted ATP-grasp superfamily ATP-dependent carboligase
MAQGLGVPIPKTQCVSTTADIDQIIENHRWDLPLVVKPVASKVWKDDLKVEVPVSIAHDVVALRNVLSRWLPVAPMLIQDFHPGVGVGQEFLACEGEILQVFQHERVHEPLRGGGSTYRRSVPLDSELLEYSARILRFLNWTGVAMVEYKRDPATGKAVLIEVNGRFWGSLPLAASAGMDFPADLYGLLVEGHRSVPRPYHTSVYCRKLTDDLYWFAENWRADHSDPCLHTVSRLRSITEWLNVVRGREHWDSFAVDDPLPALKEMLHLLRAITDSVRSKASLRFLRLLMKSKLWRRFQLRRLQDNLRQNPTLVFVCFGNICRSAFAEAYAGRQLDKRGFHMVKVESAGTYRRSSRRPPETARAVSREFDISLEHHESRPLNHQLIQSAGAIFCMDLGNYRDVLREYRAARSKTFLLGIMLQDRSQVEILDPWSMSPEYFRNCFREITEAVDRLIDLLSRPVRRATACPSLQTKPSFEGGSSLRCESRMQRN